MASTFRTPLAELLRTYNATTSTLNAVTQQVPLFDEDGSSGDEDYENHSARSKRSYNAEKNFDDEYGNMHTVIDDIYGPISEGPLPNRSR